MSLDFLDWLVIGGFLALIVWVGIRAKSGSEETLNGFFLGGRNTPWYLAGLSMVATTFAADTPLAVTELIANGGIAANWMWWSFLASGMLTTFFFAKLWQRSGVLTEAEFIEFRYSGQAAKVLRGTKALYLGLFINTIIIAWVNLALISLLEVFFGISYTQAFLCTGAIMCLTGVYSSFSGFKGVVLTDAIQFGVAMSGCIILAILVVNSEQIGGIANLKAAFIAKKGESYLSFFPTLSEDTGVGKVFSLSLTGFLAYVGVQWWASWYPGAEPGGGGYIAQRILSTRNPREAVWATLFFQIAHYCVRPWAWIVVALAGVLLYEPQNAEVGANAKLYYVYAMRDFLPNGLKGLLLAAFLAAYMSTISTQINWGASCLVNDFYKRFWKPNQTESDYVWVSKVCTVFLAGLGLAITPFLDSVAGAWGFLMQAGAGLGGVLILRWYWKRVNAWAEIAAMICPFICTFVLANFGLVGFEQFLTTVAITTLVWVLVAYNSPSTDPAVLDRFWATVHPTISEKKQAVAGVLDAPDQSQTMQPSTYYTYAFLCWGCSMLLAYSVLFLIGKMILLEWSEAGICLVVAVGSGLGLGYSMKRIV